MTVTLLYPAIVSAVPSAPSISSSHPANVLAATPHSKASFPLNVFPVRINSIALAFPIALVNLCDPPAPGIVPSLISGWPKLAESVQYRISHIKASSQPPPNAWPDTAPMMGFLMLVVSHDQDSMKDVVYASEKVRGAISFMSAPAAKAREEPVRRMAEMEGDLSKARRAVLSSVIMGVQRALRALGRLRLTVWVCVLVSFVVWVRCWNWREEEIITLANSWTWFGNEDIFIVVCCCCGIATRYEGGELGFGHLEA